MKKVISYRRLFVLIGLIGQAYTINCRAALPETILNKPFDITKFYEMRLKELLPTDAIKYVNAYEACQHWYGESPYDHERAKDIKESIERDCRISSKLEKQIYKKYKKGSSIRKIIDATIEAVGEYNHDAFYSDPFFDPENKSAALRYYYDHKTAELVTQVNEYLSKADNASQSDEKIRKLYVNLNKLSSISSRLSADTHKALLQAKQTIQKRCVNDTTCIPIPKTELHKIYQYCNLDRNNPDLQEFIRHNKIIENYYGFIKTGEKNTHMAYNKMEIKLNINYKVDHIVIDWYSMDNPPSVVEIQELIGLDVPRDGTVYWKANQSDKRYLWATLTHEDKMSKLLSISLLCGPSLMDGCKYMKLACNNIE